MKIIKLLFCFSFFIFHFSFGQSWDWGNGLNTCTSANSVYYVATDKNGNVFATGYCQADTLIIENDTLKGISQIPYLIKYNSLGNVIWAKRLIDTIGGGGAFTDLATDKFGNIYVTGQFSGSVRFDTFEIASNIPTNVFIVKYNTHGNVLWVKQSQSPSSYSGGIGFSIATDKFGNVFITGNFQDTISFGRFTLNTMYDSVIPPDFSILSDVFLVKYDSNGNVLWAKQSEVPSKYSVGTSVSVATDKIGNALITGWIGDTLIFGTDTLVESNGHSCFLVKYSPSGNILWAKQTSADNRHSFCYINSLVTDMAANVYIAGYFSDTISFGTQTLNDSGSGINIIHVFLTKYDSNGNAIWAKQSSKGWEGSGLACDAFNHIYMSGYTSNEYDYTYSDTLTFGSYAIFDTPPSSVASFIMEFDTSGNAICGSIIDNIAPGWGNGVASDSSGNYIYMAGPFDTTVFCGTDTLTPAGMLGNSFVGRWQSCTATTITNSIKSSNPSVTLYPNPNNGIFTIAFVGTQNFVSRNIEIYNVMEKKIYVATLKPVQGDHEINIGNQPNGIYLYRVISESGALIGEGKVIIEK